MIAYLSRISLRHSFLHPCKKLKQNTHYFHPPSWRLFVHALRSQNNEPSQHSCSETRSKCSSGAFFRLSAVAPYVHLRLHHRENGGSFHLFKNQIHFFLRLAGEQNARYMAKRTAATTAAAYNVHSV